MLLFPKMGGFDIVSCTSERLLKTHRPAVQGKHELFKFIGLVVMTSFHPGMSRDDLWLEEEDDFIGYPRFGRFMTKDRFNRLCGALSFVPCDEDPNHNPDVSHSGFVINPEGKEQLFHTWTEAQPLIDAFNDTRKAVVTPGPGLCVDECMCKWRGKDDRFSDGMRHVTKILRKPESIGAEIEGVCCTTCGIMLHIEMVDSKHAPAKQFDHKNLKGTAIMQRVCNHFRGSGRTVYADSAFASVHAAYCLWQQQGLYLMGPVKTATKKFPKKYLNEHEYRFQGDSVFLQADVGGCTVFATGWKDSRIKHIVSTCGTSLAGAPHHKKVWTNNGITSTIHGKEIQRDATCAEYFSNCGAIDLHNRFRQGYLALERSLIVRQWKMRLFATILGMVVVDAFFAYSYFYPEGPDKIKTFTKFTGTLAKALVFNTFEGCESDSMSASADAADDDSIDSAMSHGNSWHRFHGLTSLQTKYGLWKNKPSRRCSETNCTKQAYKYCVACTANKRGSGQMAREHVVAFCSEHLFVHSLATNKGLVVGDSGTDSDDE